MSKFDWCARGVHAPRCPGRGATVDHEVLCSCDCHQEGDDA